MPQITKTKRHEQNGQVTSSAPTIHGEKSINRKSKGGTYSTNRLNHPGLFNTGKALRILKSQYRKNYYYSDEDIIDVVLGVVAGNHFDSDPIWLHVISPPSGGKTEILNSTFECDQTFFLSDFTASSLISGYKDADNEEDDYSLLPQLDGMVVVTKDFSLIHDKPSDARSQILSILRDVYDGYASRALGNSKPKGFHSRFNYLTGMTPDIEKSWSLNTLGERFLMYRLKIENRREHARRSLRNANKSQNIRTSLQSKVKKFIDSVPKDVVPLATEEMENKILDLSDLLSTCRTYVHRERNDEMTFLPLPELASRVAKQLLRVGQSVALVRGKDSVTDDEFRVMKRIALDSLPTNRRHLLATLWRHQGKAQPVEVFETASGLAKTTTRRGLNDLVALGAVDPTKKHVKVCKNKTKMGFYKLSDTFLGYCKNVGGIPPT